MIAIFINKYIVAYKNYKEIWIKINKSRTLELSSPLGSAKLKLVEKGLKEEQRRSFIIKKSMRIRNSSQPLRNLVCNNCKISMRSTCSRTTTPWFISKSHKHLSPLERICWLLPAPLKLRASRTWCPTSSSKLVPNNTNGWNNSLEPDSMERTRPKETMMMMMMSQSLLEPSRMLTSEQARTITTWTEHLKYAKHGV